MRQRNHGRTIRQGGGKNPGHKGDVRKRDPRKPRRPRKACRGGRRRWRGRPALARVRRQVLRQPDLCFGKLLPVSVVQEALARSGLVFRACFYTPLVTLWTFLYQVLCPDPSCRAAVAHLLACLASQGQPGGTSDTGPYCKARERLPESLVADLARTTGEKLQRRRPATATLLQGRPTKIADGTTLSMPDSPENQKIYPQPPSQAPGLGFPILRLLAVISLSCGAVLDIAISPYCGKKTGETALLRQLFEQFQKGDVALVDALFANYWTFAGLLKRGADVIARHDGKRLVDWRSGKRLGKKDHLVVWKKPPQPRWMSRKAYRRMPAELCLRELAVDVCQPGFHATGGGGDQPDGRPGVSQGTNCRGVPRPLAGGTGPARHQAGPGHGHPALPDAGHGTQGNLDAPVGLQPDPHALGRRGTDGRSGTARIVLQGRTPDAQCLRSHLGRSGGHHQRPGSPVRHPAPRPRPPSRG